MDMTVVPSGQSSRLEDEMADEEAELREKYDFEIYETVNEFADEPPIRHNAHDHLPLCTPCAKEVLVSEHEEAAVCRVFRSTNNMFMAVLGGISFRVCLETRSCSCRKWDITGIPCEHGYAVILHRNFEPEEYVAHWFRTYKWRNTYIDGVIPILGAKFWPTDTGPRVHQPPEPPQPGRKKKSTKVKRKKGVNESPTKKATKKSIMHCGICGEANHNSRRHRRVDGQSSQGQQGGGEPLQGVLTQQEN